MSKMKNFYEKVNDLLLNDNTDWDVLKKAICQKYSLQEIAREYSFSDIWTKREIKDLIIEYLEDTL